MKPTRRQFLAGASCVSAGWLSALAGDAPKTKPAIPKACIDGTEDGWKALTESDFAHVNCDKDTWAWKDGVIHCTGKPVGVIQSKKPYKNFELVVQWCHLRSAGNSGVFIWATPESLAALKKGKGRLPKGIECQVLDHGYAENYIKRHKKKPDWFTTNGDVFPVGVKMKPFPPLSANGSRSFPSKNLTKGHGQWNHYYVRCINGEVRLWVNGGEVSGGTGCDPAEGYLCLESEGSPIQFKNLRIRELP
jgi:hypothetical protein